MRKGSLVSGAALATAVALMFLGSAMAADTSSGSSGASSPQVKCVGGNACKGQSACKSASNSCQGQNSCKGKGYVMTTSVQECTEKGGHAEKTKS
ncbi:MAG TPA: hypothetical protein VLL57_04640 [Candidatus Binataceae bacterium]|nr:hypothetical protein [Candidatus Binataceae bacterium]